jgi:lactate dehydrogenase-like 2-hydroxyacid dehydrogenase
MKPDVLVLSPIRPAAMEQLAARYTLHRHDLAEDGPALLATLGDRCEAVVTDGHTVLDAAMIAALPALKIVACVSAGFESIDHAALRARGVALTNGSDALVDDVADTALMLMLATRRDLIRADAHVRSGRWATEGHYPLLSGLRGKRLGVLGLGNIGQAIARRAEVLGMEIGYAGRTAKPQLPYAFFDGAPSLAQWADVLVVVLPGGPATRGMVDAAVLSALGPQGTLINVGRGSVVDEPALIAALAEGRLASAGLDVFASEPDPDPALTGLPNVVLYPHHASGTEESRAAMAQLVVDNLAAHFDGRPLLSPVS